MWGIFSVLVLGSYSFASEVPSSQNGKVLQLQQVKVGEADGALTLIKKWYMASDDTTYKIAKVDLNGDGVEEMIVHMNDYRCKRKNDGICNMFIMKLKGRGDKRRWDSMTATPRAKEVKLLPTVTKGWYDLMFDDTLYVFSKYYALDRYTEGEKAGQLITSTDELNKQKVEQFGLSLVIGSNWRIYGQQSKFKSYQFASVGYEGYLPEAKKKVNLIIGISPKNLEETFKYLNTTDVYSKTKIGVGKINGHLVDVYYFETRYENKTYGKVYLSFQDEMYFADPDNPNSDFFPMLAYISLSSKLFSDLNSKDIQTALDSYVTPLLNSIKVTDLNTFATDTTEESTPFQLKYQRKSGKKEKIVSKKEPKKQVVTSEIEEDIIDPFAKFKLIPIGKEEFVWKKFKVHASDEWYNNSVKSDETTLTLQTDDISDLEMVILNTKVFKFKKKYKKMILKEVYKSIKNDPDYSQVVLHTQSKYTVLGNKKCSVITAIGDNDKKMYTFLPYRNGKLYTIVAISMDIDEKRISSKVEELLKNISLKDDKRKGRQNRSTKESFSNLNFTVSINYTSRALQKLQDNDEKVTVSAIIDQYGKQYIEEEAVAFKDITINPGEKAVFHGIPLKESSYSYKENKKYILTINIVSARKVFINNLLICSGKIDFNIKDIKEKVLKFECKLIK